MNEQHTISDSIFWIDVEKISPNPYQPRVEFDQNSLSDLADSIRQYGILQPLVITRKETQKEDGGVFVEYELIAGERRLRASKIAGLTQVPAVIRTVAYDAKTKLELAIIENLQREDLNPADRANAFNQLSKEFGFKHSEIAKKVGRSREYVSNTIRLLSLPDIVLDAIKSKQISEGISRPILMLTDRPEEQMVLFKEIIYKKLTVREAEGIARRIAQDKVRKKELIHDPELIEIEEELSKVLGTRVQIEKKEHGGKVVISFFSSNDLRDIMNVIESTGVQHADGAHASLHRYDNLQNPQQDEEATLGQTGDSEALVSYPDFSLYEKVEEDNTNEDLYSVNNFTL